VYHKNIATSWTILIDVTTLNSQWRLTEMATSFPVCYRRSDDSLVHTVFRKATHTNLILNKLHNHPASKHSVLSTLAHRARAFWNLVFSSYPSDKKAMAAYTSLVVSAYLKKSNHLESILCHRPSYPSLKPTSTTLAECYISAVSKW
jgi:hypothetical protein